MKASQSFQILEDCDQAQECLLTSPRQSSNTLQQDRDDNGNTHNNYTKEMEENIANGNIGDDITNGNITHHSINANQDENCLNGNVSSLPLNSNRNEIHNNGNINCFKAILSEEDSANANLPL